MKLDQEPFDEEEEDKDCAIFTEGVVGDTGDGVPWAKKNDVGPDRVLLRRRKPKYSIWRESPVGEREDESSVALCSCIPV